MKERGPELITDIVRIYPKPEAFRRVRGTKFKPRYQCPICTTYHLVREEGIAEHARKPHFKCPFCEHVSLSLKPHWRYCAGIPYSLETTKKFDKLRERLEATYERMKRKGRRE